ncbi:MAG: hypothetical protein ACOYOT_12455 [Bacteroidales bacterium]
MRNSLYQTELNDAILLLEMKQSIQAQQLQKQLHSTYESLKPTNLIKSTLHEIGSSPNLTTNIISAAVGLASGYLFRTPIGGNSQSKIRKLIGTALEFGITNLVLVNADDLKHFGQTMIQQLFRKTKQKV